MDWMGAAKEGRKPGLTAQPPLPFPPQVGMPMAIATSSQMAAVESKRIRHEDMFSAMSVIVTGDDPAVRSGKPAPDIFLEAASRMGVDPKNCLVFEDSMTGVMSGKAAGCQVVAVPDSRCNKVAFLEVRRAGK